MRKVKEDGGRDGWREGRREGWRDGGREGWREGGREGGEAHTYSSVDCRVSAVVAGLHF